MILADHITQPTGQTTLDALKAILGSGGIESIDIAVAYVTTGGAYDFIRTASRALGGSWNSVPKRWVTSFDYRRTEPLALDCLKDTPNSLVRIYDAAFCLAHGGAPRVPFHPKAFLVRAAHRNFALAGSGNMSRSGLARGVEAGIVLSEPAAGPALNAMRAWFDGVWNGAAPLTTPMLSNYAQLFEGRENLKHPAPTEDDLASTDVGHGSLTAKDLQKLRVCRHLWIESGNITKNRGQEVPGNQLMLKRLSRVFFGFGPEAVPKNTHIGDVEIRFDGGIATMCSLSYSDNTMDKLGLPIPGAGGPEAYDNEYLLFRRTGPGAFALTIGTRTLKNQWLRRSVAIDGSFKMRSGREWGVF